jgi:hypothetical protein
MRFTVKSVERKSADKRRAQLVFEQRLMEVNGLVEDKKVEVSEDLKEMVTTTIDSVREGMKDRGCGVLGTIEFEIAVIKSKEAKGGFKFFIADASGNYSKESISKIKFSIIGTGTLHGSMLWLEKK